MIPDRFGKAPLPNPDAVAVPTGIILETRHVVKWFERQLADIPEITMSLEDCVQGVFSHLSDKEHASDNVHEYIDDTLEELTNLSEEVQERFRNIVYELGQEMWKLLVRHGIYTGYGLNYYYGWEMLGKDFVIKLIDGSVACDIMDENTPM